MGRFIAFFLVGFVTCSATAQEVLSYSLKPGEIYTVKQDAKQIITQQIDQAEHEITSTISGVMEFEVEEQTASGFRISMRFRDLTMQMISSSQGELLNVDAKMIDEADVQSRIFNSLLDVPIGLNLASTGEIIEVVGGDTLVKKMVDASGLTDEFTLNLMSKSLEAEFGSEALSDSYEQMTFFYSPSPISIGESWENEYSGKLSAKNKWTLDKLDAKNASITGKSTVQIKLEEPATSMALEGVQTTEITTDRISGFLVKMWVESLTEGHSTLTQLGNAEIPTTIKSTITYQLIQ